MRFTVPRGLLTSYRLTTIGCKCHRWPHRTHRAPISIAFRIFHFYARAGEIRSERPNTSKLLHKIVRERSARPLRPVLGTSPFSTVPQNTGKVSVNSEVFPMKRWTRNDRQQQQQQQQRNRGEERKQIAKCWSRRNSLRMIATSAAGASLGWRIWWGSLWTW